MEIKNLFKRKEQVNTEIPELSQLETEYKRVTRKIRFGKLLRSTIYTLIVVAASAVLIAVLFMPVLKIYGNSMAPTFNEGEIVVSVKGMDIKQGDAVCVYFGSKVLIKRCIATAGQWVDIDKDGNVYVYETKKGEPIDEPYLLEGAKALGDCNIELPYQVPADSIFVMGDNRSVSIDSRNSSVGCIDMDNIVGKIVFRVWPLESFGRVNQ